MSRNRYNRRPARCDRPLGEATLLSLQLFGETTLLSLPALAKPSSEAARVPLPRWGEASRRAAPGGPRREFGRRWNAVPTAAPHGRAAVPSAAAPRECRAPSRPYGKLPSWRRTGATAILAANWDNGRLARCDCPLGEATLLSLPALAKPPPEATLLSLPALAKPSPEAARVPLPRWGEASRRAVLKFAVIPKARTSYLRHDVGDVGLVH